MFRIYVLLLLSLQLINSKEVNTKPRIATGLEPTIVGDPVDLTTAEIEYSANIKTRVNNKVVVKTNPLVTGAFIYMNVTNVCELTEYKLCDQKGSTKVISDMRVLLENKGGGVYEGNYLIDEDAEGKISLTFFTVDQGINAFVYKDINYDKASSILFDYGKICIYGNYEVIYDGYKIIRWHGKWLFPESREYELQFATASFDQITMHTCIIYIDGVEKMRTSFNGGNEYYYQTFYMEEGEHDLVFDCNGHVYQLFCCLNWEFVADSSTWDNVVPIHFRRVNAHPVTKVIDVEIGCAPGFYFNEGIGTCKQCPRGTCQPEAGQNICFPC